SAYPRATTNRRGTVDGDPLNLVVVGDFDTILHGLGARWDETEIISPRSCWRMTKAFVLGSEYRYSPVSSLFLEGRCHDFALQKTRHTINQRLHLRLWMTPLRFMGKPVWIGQVSRDIGVRFTLKTWNLTTHAIDANVDEARDYVLDDLIDARRVSHVAYVAGAIMRSNVASTQSDGRPLFHRRVARGRYFFRDSDRTNNFGLGMLTNALRISGPTNQDAG